MSERKVRQQHCYNQEMERYCYLRNVQDLLADGKTPFERRFGDPTKGQIISVGAMVEHHPISTRDQSRLSSIWQESFIGNLNWVCIDRGRNSERRYLDSRLGRFGKVGCIRSLSSDNQRERSV